MEIEWYDASGGHPGWADLAEIAASDEDYPVHTVGYLIGQSKKTLRVVQNVTPCGCGGHSMTIPRKYVKRVRRLS